MTFSFTFQTNLWCQFVLRNPRTSWALLCFSVLAIRRPWWPCFASLAEPAGLCKHCRWKEVHCTAAVYTADLRIQCTYLPEGVCGYAFPLPVNWLPPTTHPPTRHSLNRTTSCSFTCPTHSHLRWWHIHLGRMYARSPWRCLPVPLWNEKNLLQPRRKKQPPRSVQASLWAGLVWPWRSVDWRHRPTPQTPTGRDSADSASQKRATGWGFPPLFLPLWPPKD